jgi:hypothetical protein
MKISHSEINDLIGEIVDQHIESLDVYKSYVLQTGHSVDFIDDSGYADHGLYGWHATTTSTNGTPYTAKLREVLYEQLVCASCDINGLNDMSRDEAKADLGTALDSLYAATYSGGFQASVSNNPGETVIVPDEVYHNQQYYSDNGIKFDVRAGNDTATAILRGDLYGLNTPGTGDMIVEIAPENPSSPEIDNGDDSYWLKVQQEAASSLSLPAQDADITAAVAAQRCGVENREPQRENSFEDDVQGAYEIYRDIQNKEDT